MLEPTPDILARARRAPGATGSWSGSRPRRATSRRPGARKLARKHLDLLVANEVGREGTGFGSDTNDADDPVAPTATTSRCATWTKAELAAAICDRIVASLGRGMRSRR